MHVSLKRLVNSKAIRETIYIQYVCMLEQTLYSTMEHRRGNPGCDDIQDYNMMGLRVNKKHIENKNRSVEGINNLIPRYTTLAENSEQHLSFALTHVLISVGSAPYTDRLRT